ncbi:unnamed protein product [Prunus brigantina]
MDFWVSVYQGYTICIDANTERKRITFSSRDGEN